MNMTLSRLNPLRELEDFQHRILNAFNPSFHRNGADHEGNSFTAPDWIPPVDIVEDDKEYLISLEIPEVPKETVRVTMEDGELTIRGERTLLQGENRRYHRSERSYGTFARSFSVPNDTDHNSVQASFKEGMLYIRIAKKEQAKPREIEVKAAD